MIFSTKDNNDNIMKKEIMKYAKSLMALKTELVCGEEEFAELHKKKGSKWTFSI